MGQRVLREILNSEMIMSCAVAGAIGLIFGIVSSSGPVPKRDVTDFDQPLELELGGLEYTQRITVDEPLGLVNACYYSLYSPEN